MLKYNERLTKNNKTIDELTVAVETLPNSKSEQIKNYNISKNGDTMISPDPGTTIKGGVIHVEVASSGGVSIPTCSVVCNSGGGFEKFRYTITAVIDGALVSIQESGSGSKTYNIPCNSIVYAEGYGGNYATFSGAWNLANTYIESGYVRIAPSVPTAGLKIN